MTIFSKNGKELLAALSLALITSILVLINNSQILGPVIQADEGSYLANAAAIAGHNNDMAGSYHAGYSFIISPAYIFWNNPTSIWKSVLTINAVIFLTIPLLLWAIAREINPQKRVSQIFFPVLAVSAYPMWVTMSGYSFSQIAFIPFYLLVSALIATRITERTKWAAVGVCCGLTYWIHPIGVSPIIAAIIISTYHSYKIKKIAPTLITITTITITVLLYQKFITPWLYGRMTISGLDPRLHYPDSSKILSAFSSSEGIKNLISRTSGHIFYLTIGTVGIIWIGFVKIAKNLVIERQDNNPNEKLLHIFVALSFLGALALSVLLFSSTTDGQRIDRWMYGRYVESVLAPILLIGLLASSFRSAWIGIPITTCSAFLLSMGLDTHGPVERYNISALWQIFILKEQGLGAWAVSGIIIIILFIYIPRSAAIALALVAFMFSSHLQTELHNSSSKLASERWPTALKARKLFPKGTCVAFDHSGITDDSRYALWFDFSFLLYDYKLQRMTPEAWEKSCDGPLFSYDKALSDKLQDIHPISISFNNGITLWGKGQETSTHIYPIEVANDSPYLLQTIGEGWFNLESTHIWSTNEATLNLPIPNDCHEVACTANLTIQAFGASESDPIKLVLQSLRTKSSIIEVSLENAAAAEIKIPLNSKARSEKVKILILNAKSPKSLLGVNDSRVLGISLTGIRLVKEVKDETHKGQKTKRTSQIVHKVIAQ
ncbi:hypothetical protein D9M70_124080 [compost metagenome]